MNENNCFGFNYSIDNLVCSNCKVKHSCKKQMQSKGIEILEKKIELSGKWSFRDLRNDPIKLQRFIDLWNKAYTNGIQRKLMSEFNMSISQIYLLRKKLGLHDLMSRDHPGRKKFVAKIVKMYVEDKLSSWKIAQRTKFNSQSILNILKQEGVQKRSRKIINVISFRVKNSTLKHSTLIKGIRDDYILNKLNIKEISKKYGIDQGTVSNKLKAMNILKSDRTHRCPSNYPCKWCGTIMEKVNVTIGPRKQKYCCHSCKNKAKDYRKYFYKKRIVSDARMEEINNYLKSVWGNKFEEVKQSILADRKLSNE